MAPVNTLEHSPTRLVVGGWRMGSILMGIVLFALPVGVYVLFVRDEPAAIWANLFAAAICWALVLRMELWERIVFDAQVGEVTFDQWRLLGRTQRAAPLTPVSRVDIESISSSSNNKGSYRLVLVTGDTRTPFTTLFSRSPLSGNPFKAEQAFLNDWLTGAYGDRWRQAARRLADTPQSASDPASNDGVPAGFMRVRHPRTGLAVDVPEDWATSVSLDWRGPLRIFGVTLINRLERPGDKRPVGDGGDWNMLIARGKDDCSFQLSIIDEPLDKTLDDAMDDPWSKRLGLEVLKTTPDLKIGGLTGFSLVRRKRAGESGTTPGKETSAPVATRQLWLSRDGLHLEVTGTARLDDPQMQSALDAMFSSIRLP